MYKPGFGGRLLFSLRRCRFFSTSTRTGLRSAFHGRCCGSTTLVDRCVIRDTISSMVGAGLRLLSAGSPTVSQSSPSP
jgi:hypothetical protein